MVLVKEDSDSHSGRKSIKYSDKNAYQYNGEHYSNAEFIRCARKVLGLEEQACWFVYSIEVYNQDDKGFCGYVYDKKYKVAKYFESKKEYKHFMRRPLFRKTN